MICSRLAVWVAAAGVAPPLCLWSSSALARADIPAAIVSSNEPEKSREVIRAFIKEQVGLLASDDPAARSTARDALWMKAVSAPPATANFQDLYLSELAPELTKAFSDEKLSTRLNAAIVAAKAGSTTVDRQGRLAPAVEAALNDKQRPVLIWAMKAAGQQLPVVLARSEGGGANNSLLSKLGQVAAANANTTLAVEGYDALTLTTFSSGPQQLPDRISETAWTMLVPLILPELDKFWNVRMKVYAAGEPEEPLAEAIPARFIAAPRTWSALSAPQKMMVVQNIYNQIALGNEHITSASSPAAKEPFVRMIFFSASALETIAGIESGAGGMEAAARAVKGIQTSTTPANAQEAVDKLRAAIQTVPTFQKLTEAPKRTAASAGPG